MLENINILSIPGFTFFILLILVGYLFVEIFFDNGYFFKYLLKKYHDNLFDRLLHYIFWGFIINVLVILLYIETNSLGEYFKIFQNIYLSTLNLKDYFSIGTLENIQISLMIFCQFILSFIMIIFIKASIISISLMNKGLTFLLKYYILYLSKK